MKKVEAIPCGSPVMITLITPDLDINMETSQCDVSNINNRDTAMRRLFYKLYR
ncbi:MAG: hypothetical protein J6X12_11795 [Paludibacteraceae bacterium]|nr:hypothetical protein [Paludibacteraceae bacterium]